MGKKILWIVVNSLMALSLVLAACGQPAAPTAPTAPSAPTTPAVPTAPTAPTAPTTPTTEKPQQEVVKPATEAPKYGGVLMLSTNSDPQSGWDSNYVTAGSVWPINLTNQGLWQGDWAKGPAGGYGTKETDWRASYDIFDHKAGYIAESTKWTIDDAKGEGTIIYQIRQGVHWALNPASEASRLVGGRELTADDVVFELKRAVTNPTAYIYLAQPEVRGAEITKTGPWEVTLKVKLDGLMSALSRLGDSVNLHPPEIIKKYGDAKNWRNSVGTGAFMLTDYVPGSTGIFARNPNYWMKDPVGPGKGNQLPYLDSVKVLIIPDASTELAALRTGKIDWLASVAWEDATQMRKTTPALLGVEIPGSSQGKTFMRTDLPPLNDVRVRRAMMMAIDFKAILQNLYDGVGDYNTFPHFYMTAYAGLRFELDDPKMPESVKELYSYNPEKAKTLLKEAGYPNGFKTSVLIQANQVDYYSILKDMWAKVGIDLKLDIRDAGTHAAMGSARSYEALSTTGGQGPTAIFYLGSSIAGESRANGSMINDPVINEGLAKIRRAALTDIFEAMKMYRELTPYVMDQAYAIPAVQGTATRFWWPWLKNYSGEYDVGYFNFIGWSGWVWLDQELKKSMGY
ncbi:MAG: ABC transporter substrate-binding protein [Chloroflexi bacterium]|nr:ABC transporter substrate-binding protein [Chloroflexota bacterium]